MRRILERLATTPADRNHEHVRIAVDHERVDPPDRVATDRGLSGNGALGQAGYISFGRPRFRIACDAPKLFADALGNEVGVARTLSLNVVEKLEQLGLGIATDDHRPRRRS